MQSPLSLHLRLSAYEKQKYVPFSRLRYLLAMSHTFYELRGNDVHKD